MPEPEPEPEPELEPEPKPKPKPEPEPQCLSLKPWAAKPEPERLSLKDWAWSSNSNLDKQGSIFSYQWIRWYSSPSRWVSVSSVGSVCLLSAFSNYMTFTMWPYHYIHLLPMESSSFDGKVSIGCKMLIYKLRFIAALGVESNWNSFEIRSIRFENLRFDWFEKAKKFEKFDSFDLKEKLSKNSKGGITVANLKFSLCLTVWPALQPQLFRRVRPFTSQITFCTIYLSFKGLKWDFVFKIF